MGDWTNHERPQLFEMYATWASGGGMDEAFGFAVAVCKTQQGDVDEALYDLRAMGFDSANWGKNTRRVKDWAYELAADFVTSRRGQTRIRDYRLDWGHQAARDGLGLALWGNLYDLGLASRGEAFGVSRRTYERVRDHVRHQAADKIDAFDAALYEKCTNQD